MDKQKGKSKNKKEKIWKIVKRETQVLKAIINQTRSIGNEFLVINIKAGIEAGRDAGLRGQGCTRRFSPAGQNGKPTTASTRETPKLQPWPRAMESKIVQTTPELGKETHGAYIFLLIYSLVDPTAVQRGGRHCCPGGIGTKNSS